MTKIKLTKRLQTIANCVDELRVCDVGCDHGKLVGYLFQNNIINYAFVSDISAPSLNKAVKLLQEMSVNFDYAVGDGLTVVNKPVDLCVIAGMGGVEIKNILNANTTDITKFVLQPQNNSVELKKYLISHNFCITYDVIVCDKGKFYNILKCEKTHTKQKLTKQQLYFATNTNDSDYAKYLDYEYNKTLNIVKGMPYFKSLAKRKYLKLIAKAKHKLER